MKPAVLAYCQEACPIVDSEYVMSPGTKLVHRVLKGDWTQWELQCWNGGTCQWERAFCASPYMGDDDPHFGYLYRIFGLEKMDERESMMKTVDALSAMVSVDPVAYSDLEDALEAERGKSAKLVEAFEEIKAVKLYGIDDTDQGFESSHDAFREVKYIANMALEAYKEGKKDE